MIKEQTPIGGQEEDEEITISSKPVEAAGKKKKKKKNKAEKKDDGTGIKKKGVSFNLAKSTTKEFVKLSEVSDSKIDSYKNKPSPAKAALKKKKESSPIKHKI